MRTRKTAHYDGPRSKRPSHGRKPRTTQPESEVRFGIRTTEGDVYLTTPTERLQDSINLAHERADTKRRLLDNFGGSLANIELPDHW